MAENIIRPKFRVVEPDSSVRPPEPATEMTPEQIQAASVSDFESTFDCTVNTKCRTCDGFKSCALLSVISGQNIVGRNNPA